MTLTDRSLAGATCAPHSSSARDTRLRVRLLALAVFPLLIGCIYSVWTDPASQRRRTVHAWEGWTAASGTTTKMACTWAEWCAWHQRTQRVAQRQQERIGFSDRELAHLSFVRWLSQTGRLAPPGNDTD